MNNLKCCYKQINMLFIMDINYILNRFVFFTKTIVFTKTCNMLNTFKT